MTSAGKILIRCRDEYSPTETYEVLDLVYHNGTSYIAKKNCSGIEPSRANNGYWQIVFDADAFLEAKIEEKVRAYMQSNT